MLLLQLSVIGSHITRVLERRHIPLSSSYGPVGLVEAGGTRQWRGGVGSEGAEKAVRGRVYHNQEKSGGNPNSLGIFPRR